MVLLRKVWSRLWAQEDSFERPNTHCVHWMYCWTGVLSTSETMKPFSWESGTHISIYFTLHKIRILWIFASFCERDWTELCVWIFDSLIVKIVFEKVRNRKTLAARFALCHPTKRKISLCFLQLTLRALEVPHIHCCHITIPQHSTNYLLFTLKFNVSRNQFKNSRVFSENLQFLTHV